MLLLAALVAVAAPVTPAQHLARGEAAMAALDYEIAADELMRAATAPEASDDEKLRANLLAGIAHRILGRDLEARINFRYVLLRAPETTLDADAPPKVALFFASVRQEVEAERAAQAPALPRPEALPAPVPPAQQDGPSTAVVAGAVVAGAGAVVLVGGAGGLAYAESALADPTRPGAERGALRAVGQVSAVGAGAGVLLAIAGGVIVGVAAGGEP
ncbi:MAG: hypothetical protein HYS27_09955 [Deltaproteobacteria bacterium]|nr:hypothetical protein [Deltaproteobacteria bacterium]